MLYFNKVTRASAIWLVPRAHSANETWSHCQFSAILLHEMDTHNTPKHTQSKAFGYRLEVTPTQWTSTRVFMHHSGAKSQCQQIFWSWTNNPQEAVPK